MECENPWKYVHNGRRSITDLEEVRKEMDCCREFPFMNALINPSLEDFHRDFLGTIVNIRKDERKEERKRDFIKD